MISLPRSKFVLLAGFVVILREFLAIVLFAGSLFRAVAVEDSPDQICSWRSEK